MPLSFYIVSNLLTQNSTHQLQIHFSFHDSVQIHGIFRFQKQKTYVIMYLSPTHNAHYYEDP